MLFNKPSRFLFLASLSVSSVFAGGLASSSEGLSVPSKWSLSSLKEGHPVFQLGGYCGIQGKEQHIDIDSLIGDTFTTENRQASNGLAGIGYFIEGQEKGSFAMSYGVNAFYLAKTSASGNVIQENLFTNLSYGYHITHYPVYAIAKSTWDLKSSKYALTVDAGIGPNFMRADGFQEHSLDGGVTIPDNIFSAYTSTVFSATAGVGVKINSMFGRAPLECGYRFFYLGQGRFNNTTNQVLNTFGTGTAYGNAILCAITV